jgi:cbb3-type cytochrome oxidase subunit 3
MEYNTSIHLIYFIMGFFFVLVLMATIFHDKRQERREKRNDYGRGLEQQGFAATKKAA